MLILQRDPGESIMIGTNVRVFLVKQKGKGCRLGIVAPDDVTVHRTEVMRDIAERAVAEGRIAEGRAMLDAIETTTPRPHPIKERT